MKPVRTARERRAPAEKRTASNLNSATGFTRRNARRMSNESPLLILVRPPDVRSLAAVSSSSSAFGRDSAGGWGCGRGCGRCAAGRKRSPTCSRAVSGRNAMATSSRAVSASAQSAGCQKSTRRSASIVSDSSAAGSCRCRSERLKYAPSRGPTVKPTEYAIPMSA